MDSTNQSDPQSSLVTNCHHCSVCHEFCQCNGLEWCFEKHFLLEAFLTSEAKATILRNIFYGYTKESNQLFAADNWKPEIFSQAESKLFDVKCLLNKYKVKQWNSITYHLDLSIAARKSIKTLFDPLSRHTLTITWSKLRELLVEYHSDLFRNIIECSPGHEVLEYKSLHLCEMPGSFVRSLKFYIQENFPTVHFKWMATSLNHYHEQYDVLDSEFVSYRNISEHDFNNWLFFESDKGDILDKNDLLNAIQTEESPGKKAIIRRHYDLITCDGGFSCEHNPAKQERILFPLKFIEVITSLTALKASGCLIVKFYSIFESSTICLVYLLYLLFEKVYITKPFTSKHGNSEIYLVCTNYLPDEDIDEEALNSFLECALAHDADPIGDKALFHKHFVDERFLSALFTIEDRINTYQSNCIQQCVSLYDRTKNQDSCCYVNLRKAHDESKKMFTIKNRLNSDKITDLCKRYDEEVASSILDFEHENYLDNPLTVCNRPINSKPLRKLKHVLTYEERLRSDNWIATRFALDVRGLPKIITDFELTALCKDIFSKILYVDSDESRHFMKQKNLRIVPKLVKSTSINLRSMKSSRFADNSLVNLLIDLKKIHEKLIDTCTLSVRHDSQFGPLKLSDQSTFYNHSFRGTANLIGTLIKNDLLVKILTPKDSPQDSVFDIIEWALGLDPEQEHPQDRLNGEATTAHHVGRSSLECVIDVMKQHFPACKINLGPPKETTDQQIHSARSCVHLVGLKENRDDKHYFGFQDEWLICNKLVETLTKLLQYELENVNDSMNLQNDTVIVFTLPHLLTRATVGLLFLLHNTIFEQFCIVPRIPFYNMKKTGSNSQNWRDRNQEDEATWESDISLNHLVIMKSSADAKGSRYKANIKDLLPILTDIQTSLTKDPDLCTIQIVPTPFILANKRFYEQIYAANFVRTLAESSMLRTPIYDNIDRVKEIRSSDPSLVPNLVLYGPDLHS